jgi:hypothetical protein
MPRISQSFVTGSGTLEMAEIYESATYKPQKRNHINLSVIIHIALILVLRSILSLRVLAIALNYSHNFGYPQPNDRCVKTGRKQSLTMDSDQR